MALEPGLEASISRVVAQDDTAIAVGSGDVPVLGTPRLVAWCEAATVAAIASQLDDGTTTVGTNVTIDHLAPTRVGAAVAVAATLDAVDGRSLTFAVAAYEGDTLIARGTIARVAVNRARFLA